jgi:DNA repair protein RadC
MYAEKSEQKPYYTRHRDGLRERFLTALDALPDYELLELLLSMAIPRRDVKPIAKRLIARYHNLAGVMNATRADIDMTKQIWAAAAPFNIIVHDHLIVSSGGVTSFKSLGLM